jgi:adenylosuccinate lyase
MELTLIHDTVVTFDGSPANTYRSPFDSRYCSPTAKLLASEPYRWANIRAVWLAVLRSQVKFGLLPNAPTPEAIQTFADRLTQFDWQAIAALEAELFHDVDAHRTYVVTQLVPELGPNLHVALTSQDPQCNGEGLVQNAWLQHVRGLLLSTIAAGAELAGKNAACACLGETHWQEATAKTFGHRVAMWMGPLLDDLAQLDYLLDGQRLKGIHGATGTNEAMLKLCHGNREQLNQLLIDVETQLGVPFTESVVGQTYPRSWDASLVSLFASICTNLAKAAFDIRFLCSHHEVAEPRGKKQKGSSAMPWKRNPMKCERLQSLARVPSCFLVGIHEMVRTQGLERTLDDSAFRRLALPESFLATDACLRLAHEVLNGLQVYPESMGARLELFRPFLLAEDLIAEVVSRGGSRDEAYAELHQVAGEVWDDLLAGRIKSNDFLDQLSRTVGSVFTEHHVPLQLPPVENMLGVCVPETVAFCDRTVALLAEPANAAAIEAAQPSLTKSKV